MSALSAADAAAPVSAPRFAERIAAWQRTHGRHDLPWQGTRDPYRRWVSEIMLQQTQVAAVIPYYARFLARFPDVDALAAAPLEAVLECWSGLGYYSRARNLHAAAQAVAARGRFPGTAAELAELPGIGRSTAAAIAVFSAGERVAILDGNVRRVLCRHRGIEGFPGTPSVERRLWQIAEAALPGTTDLEAYTQGQMDLGATVCTRARPRCTVCPVADDCVALADDRVADLPTPRTRRALPMRAATMLVMHRGGEVLLERRPASGIWGGLWSLPEVEPPGVVAHVSALGLQVEARQALRPLVHRFTHFGLEIRPLLLAVRPLRAAPYTAQDCEDPVPSRRWLAADAIADAALPRPIKTLLLALAAGGFRGQDDAA